MIAGIGIDLVDVVGFREQLADPASCFAEFVFTAGERRDATDRPGGDPARHLAARWAAKEAFVKAWSAALGESPNPMSSVDFREIEVVSDLRRRPTLTLHGRTAEAFASLGPVTLHVSLTHDGPCAAAFVTLDRPLETAQWS
jgi:holo-[acyl-carrier protein] synthase